MALTDFVHTIEKELDIKGDIDFKTETKLEDGIKDFIAFYKKYNTIKKAPFIKINGAFCCLNSCLLNQSKGLFSNFYFFICRNY